MSRETVIRVVLVVTFPVFVLAASADAVRWGLLCGWGNFAKAWRGYCNAVRSGKESGR